MTTSDIGAHADWQGANREQEAGRRATVVAQIDLLYGERPLGSLEESVDDPSQPKEARA